MIPGINQKQLRQAMKQMGMKQEDIEADEVIIKTKDKKLIIKNPGVAKVTMMGEISYQITGNAVEEEIDSSEVELSDEDIETVMEQADCSREDAETTLKKNKGDIAQTILELQDNE